EQAQQVAGRAARAADRLGGLLVRVAELVDQAPYTLCLLERIEVLALDVLDQGERERRLVVGLAHDDRYFIQFGDARRPEAPLARDDLVAARPAVARLDGQGPDHDGLHHAVLADRSREFLDRAFVHPGAGLVAPGLQAPERQVLG